MENASKALIIAAGMLIGIIIASIFTYEMVHMTQNAEVYQKNLENTKIVEFNTQFEKYANKGNITAQEVITIYNYVIEWNENNSNYIEINTDQPSKDFQKVLNKTMTIEEFIKNAIVTNASGKITKEKKYKLIIKGYNSEGLVNKITIHEN